MSSIYVSSFSKGINVDCEGSFFFFRTHFTRSYFLVELIGVVGSALLNKVINKDGQDAYDLCFWLSLILDG